MPLRSVLAAAFGALLLLPAADDGLTRNDGDEAVPEAPRPAARPAKPASAPAPAAPAAPASDPAPLAPGKEDAHFLFADDWFIADRPYPNHGWIYVRLSKRLQAPSDTSRNEGQYLQVGDGKEMWTAHAWRSRAAVAADLRLGATIIIFEHHQVDDVYLAPKDRENARHGSWFMSKITDLDQMYKQVVRAGDYNAHVGAIRVPLP